MLGLHLFLFCNAFFGGFGVFGGFASSREGRSIPYRPRFFVARPTRDGQKKDATEGAELFAFASFSALASQLKLLSEFRNAFEERFRKSPLAFIFIGKEVVAASSNVRRAVIEAREGAVELGDRL